MSSMAVPLSGSLANVPAQPVPATAVPVTQQLAKNPQLPQHPLGAYTDAQYEAQNAALRSNIAKQYADILQQLGYVDPSTGQFIQGSVETDANRQRGLLNRSMQLADEDVTHQHQQNGTLFSGLRGTDQARAEFPFTDQLGQLEINTPLALSKLYEQAGGLTSDYTLQDNQLIADAAARQAAGLAQSGAGGAQPTAPGGAPTPPPTPGAGFTGVDPGVLGRAGIGLGGATNADNFREPSIGTTPTAPVPVSPVTSGISAAAQQALLTGGNIRRPGVQL